MMMDVTCKSWDYAPTPSSRTPQWFSQTPTISWKFSFWEHFFIIIYQKHRDNDHPHQFPNVLQHRALAGNVPLIMHDWWSESWLIIIIRIMIVTSQTFSGTVLWLAMCLCNLHSRQFGSYSLQPPLCTWLTPKLPSSRSRWSITITSHSSSSISSSIS